MMLTLKTRRRLSLLLLCVGLPVYIGVTVTIVSSLQRPHIVIEFAIYAAAGILWAVPFKKLFRGIGAADPTRKEKG
ncbi:MAG: DUF2842 domain-containing protein [Rhodobacteraceae bacterium]|nr:DUF2842 domain-containing protein [Paracoccaceae bacterium]MCY4195579.1 DUF2842 domain-containing protein [Paracoccaceae bacterium]